MTMNKWVRHMFFGLAIMWAIMAIAWGIAGNIVLTVMDTASAGLCVLIYALTEDDRDEG